MTYSTYKTIQLATLGMNILYIAEFASTAWERERVYFLPVHVSQKNDYTYSSNSAVTQYNDLCTMAVSTEKPLGYRVKMFSDTNAVNSKIKK